MYGQLYTFKGYRQLIILIKVLLDLILYVSVTTFSVIFGRVFLGLTNTKQGLMCLAQGHKG